MEQAAPAAGNRWWEPVEGEPTPKYMFKWEDVKALASSRDGAAAALAEDGAAERVVSCTREVGGYGILLMIVLLSLEASLLYNSTFLGTAGSPYVI